MGVRRVTITKLVDEHYESVYRFAYRLTGNVEDAEELVQETFCVAQERLDQLKNPQRARSWLFTIAKRIFLQEQRRRRVLPLEAAPETVVHDSGSEEITSEELQRALDQLPPEFRLPLVLYYFGEHSYREIAEILELPLGTVMSRLARAKHRLRSLLGLEPLPSRREG